MRNFITGFIYPFKCFGLFFKYPKTILLSIIPVFINLIIYISTFLFFYIKIIELSKSLTGANNPATGFWSDFFNTLILIISFLLLLIICYFVVLIIGGIITAPFNENISLIIEENITGKKSEYSPGFWLDTWMNIKSELLKLLFYFSFIFLFFLIGFIPLIGTIISVVLGTIFSFFFNALDFLDYPMTRKYMTLEQKIKSVYSKPMYSLGFGCSVFLLMVVPLINVLLKPICVVAGTAFYFDKKYN